MAGLRVGMVGAGQLARMTQQAAVDLGITLVVLARSADEPAVTAGSTALIGEPDDRDALMGLAQCTDAVTFDHELVPNDLVAELESAGFRVAPGSVALRCAQDKLVARETFSAAGLPVPAFTALPADEDGAVAAVAQFAAENGWPVVVKARSGGYDGRGVAVAADADSVADSLAAVGGAERGLMVEAHVDLAMEVASVGARRASGQWVSYPLVHTHQVNGICRELSMPAVLPDGCDPGEAGRLAGRIAEVTGATGILAVELFVEAGSGRLVINEIALRPHNSAHATIEGCVTSQFHNHLRAVLDLPLGDTSLRSPAAAMVNILGPADGSDPADRLAAGLKVPQAGIHLYGKASTPGRKVGHVTAVGASAEEALGPARRCVEALTGEKLP